MFLEISQNLQEKTCARASLLIKLQAWGLQLYERQTLAQLFSCEFCEISKNTFFTEHVWATAWLYKLHRSYLIIYFNANLVQTSWSKNFKYQRYLVIILFAYFVGNKAKGRISKRVLQENKAHEFYEKWTFLTPWYAHVRNFFGIFGLLFFYLATRILMFCPNHSIGFGNTYLLSRWFHFDIFYIKFKFWKAFTVVNSVTRM